MKEKAKQNKRRAGILLPISALPSNYGIGTFGLEAYHFVEQLKQAGQKYWQVLPVGPTSYGDSPYQSFSAFAGNPYFIDLDFLMEEELLKADEVTAVNWGERENEIDYEKIYLNRFTILKKAFQRSQHKGTQAYKEFREEASFWLHDYSLYMAVKNNFEDHEWLLWDDDIKFREKEALERYEEELSEEIEFWKFCQFKFYEQWKRLKQYANKQGIRIIGDIPLYVALDSADVWVHSQLFELDERKNPIHIAGVPPDYFSATGQRWGNPLYRWDRMQDKNFDWWRERMAANARLYDVIRIDHFIGIVRYFSIPASCPTAVEGEYIEGPGIRLTDVIKESIGDSEIIAEDLGVVSASVRNLIQKTEWPGMKVLEFAFDSGADNENLPHRFTTTNCVVYGGTHDNETMAGFFEGQKKKELEYIMNYVQVKKKSDICQALIRTGYASIADTAIYQLQDILELDNCSRMNCPGILGGNWQWRVKKGEWSEKQILKLKELALIYGRE